MNPVTLSLSKGGLGYGSTGFVVSSAERLTMTGMNGMNTAVSSDPRIQEVRVTDDGIIAHLVDGRVISVPLAWSWRLSDATPAQRANFRLIGTGQRIHWPDVDEDISVEGMLHGVPARRPRSAAAATRVRPAHNDPPPGKRRQPTPEKRRASVGRRNARG